MEQITPDEEIAMITDRLSMLVRRIGGLRHAIEALEEKAQVEGKIDSSDATKMLGQINALVVACTKTENFLDECRNKQAGIAKGGYALDLERARADIGCKLDQLRGCGCSGSLPE
ncbi:MAG: hypothetical protein AAF744_03855 [Pseudomonadota bacterium]